MASNLRAVASKTLNSLNALPSKPIVHQAFPVELTVKQAPEETFWALERWLQKRIENKEDLQSVAETQPQRHNVLDGQYRITYSLVLNIVFLQVVSPCLRLPKAPVCASNLTASPSCTSEPNPTSEGPK